MSRIANLLLGLPLSAEEIALKTRIRVERIGSILAGDDTTLAELRALARGLRIPIRTFTKADETDSDLALLFRATSSARPDLGVETAASFVQAAIAILPTRSSAPEWLSMLKPSQETYAEAARLADQFRLLFCSDRLDDPLHDLPDVLVNLGGIVLGRLETSRFEGASVIADGYGFVFISPRFAGRMLFTLAHELGHLIAHHSEERAVVFDLSSQIGGRRYKSASEAFVDAFASVLLMPARGVAIALRQIREMLRIKSDAIGDIEILYLARFYGVSFEAAALRCEKLELLPGGGAMSLAEVLRREHGGPEKRADALGLPKRQAILIPRVSRNLLSAAGDKIKDGKISLGWVTDRLGCSANDIFAPRAASEASRGYHR